MSPEIYSPEDNISKRTYNLGAEKWLGKKIEVLDQGFVYLADYMGGDTAIEQAARVSYGIGTRKTSETEGLIRYLLRNEHTSPFEMVEFKFHAKMPIFVARQWVRHRTASINEYSGRYSVMKNEFYIPNPENISYQSDNNKQGRGAPVNPVHAEDVRANLKYFYQHAENLYVQLLGNNDNPGIAKELARIPLPLSTYTEWYWKIDLHNLLHFLKLRTDPHAQMEIRQYANAISEIVKDAVPITWKAFEDYQLNAVKLSGPEKEILSRFLENSKFSEDEARFLAGSVGLTGKGEISEMVEKFKKLGIIK